MKKFLVVIFIAFLFLPLSAFSETDPIVGVWYICIDTNDLSKDLSSQGYSYGVMICEFSEDGEIIFTEIDFKGSSAEVTDPTYMGKWEKNGNEYKTSIIAAGVDRAWFEDDLLYVCINKVQYHGFRKMKPIDMYNNIYRK